MKQVECSAVDVLGLESVLVPPCQNVEMQWAGWGGPGPTTAAGWSVVGCVGWKPWSAVPDKVTAPGGGRPAAK